MSRNVFTLVKTKRMTIGFIKNLTLVDVYTGFVVIFKFISYKSKKMNKMTLIISGYMLLTNRTTTNIRSMNVVTFVRTKC